MKDTAGDVFTKEQLDLLAGRCKICKCLEINGGGEEGVFYETCNSDYVDDIDFWDKAWGHTLPCPFFVTDLRYCAEHEEVTTSDIECGGCLLAFIEDQTTKKILWQNCTCNWSLGMGPDLKCPVHATKELVKHE